MLLCWIVSDVQSNWRHYIPLTCFLLPPGHPALVLFSLAMTCGPSWTPGWPSPAHRRAPSRTWLWQLFSDWSVRSEFGMICLPGMNLSICICQLKVDNLGQQCLCQARWWVSAADVCWLVSFCWPPVAVGRWCSLAVSSVTSALCALAISPQSELGLTAAVEAQLHLEPPRRNPDILWKPWTLKDLSRIKSTHAMLNPWLGSGFRVGRALGFSAWIDALSQCCSLVSQGDWASRASRRSTPQPSARWPPSSTCLASKDRLKVCVCMDHSSHGAETGVGRAGRGSQWCRIGQCV